MSLSPSGRLKSRAYHEEPVWAFVHPPRRQQTTAPTPCSARVAIVANTTQLPGCPLRKRSWGEAFTRVPILVRWHLLLLVAENRIGVLRYILRRVAFRAIQVARDRDFFRELVDDACERMDSGTLQGPY